MADIFAARAVLAQLDRVLTEIACFQVFSFRQASEQFRGCAEIQAAPKSDADRLS
jgi:hypothetical protein